MTAIALVCSALFLGAEMIIDVPEGTIVTNTVAINAATAGDVLVKTGKGTWYTEEQIGCVCNFSKMEIREGTFENACATCFFAPPRIEIRAGATLKQMSNASYKNNNVTIQIDKGGIFNDWCTQGSSFSTLKDVTGEGTFVNYASTMLASSLPNFSGDFILAQEKGGWVTFGDGTNAANDPDVNRFGSFTMYGQFGSGRYPELTFNNVSPMTVTNRIYGLGQLFVKSGREVTLTDLVLINGTESSVCIDGTLKTVNARIALPVNANYFRMNNANSRLDMSGGVFYGAWPTTWSGRPYSRLKYPNYSMLQSNGPFGYGIRILRDGAEFWTGFQQPYRTEVYSGAALVIAGGFQTSSAKSATEPITLLFDDGILRTPSDFSATSPGGVQIEIGSGGWIAEAVGEATRCPDINYPTQYAIRDNGSNGPLTLRGSCTHKFSLPLDIGGDVTLEDSQISINSVAAFYADGATPLGRGDFIMGTSQLYSSLPKGSALKLANGSGAKLRLKGAAVLGIATTTAGTDWEIGPSDATATPIVREKGSGLFFVTGQSGMFKSGVGACVVHGGIPLGGNGKLPVWPLLLFDKSSDVSGDTWGGQVNFLTCDASGNVALFTDYATTLGNDPTAVVYLGSGQTLSEDKAAAALCIAKAQVLTIPAGRTLTLGDGTGTATVLLDNGNLKGAGTIDFGAAEGIVACQARGGTFGAVVAGTGGLTYLGHSAQDMNASSFYVTGANTYSGGTYVNYRVSVRNDSAFGTGDVWALGGPGRGGQLYFEKGYPKRTIANNLHVSGRGWKRGNTVGNDGGEVRGGAIWARGSVEFTGEVDLAGATRVSVEFDGTEVRFSGPVSGDSIELYNYMSSITNAGTVVFSAPNTYIGETRVIRSTLVVEETSNLGLGETVLDGGKLVLNVPKSGLTLPNRIRGAGTVKLEGPANAYVQFAQIPTSTEDPFFQAEHLLDVTGANRAVNTLEGFTAVTNTSTHVVHLSVIDDKTYTGAVGPNIVLHYGSIYRPGFTLLVW